MRISVLVCFWCLCLGLVGGYGALTLASYSPTGAPSTTAWSSSGTTANVSAQLVQTDGQSAWKISDSGVAAGGGANSNRWYKHTVATAYRPLLSQGWEANLQLKIPDLTEISDTSSWTVNSNTWWSVSTPLPGSGQHTYALMFGRDTLGQGILQAYSNSGTQTLSSGFHHYRLVFDPSVSTETVAVFVDGQFWKKIAPSVHATNSNAEMVWGDNLSQSASMTPRVAYYGDISFTTVPEPMRALLAIVGIGALAFRRRRVS